MANAITAVGIDVAKATLSVCLRDPEGSERALTLRNTEADMRTKVLPLLAGFSGKIVMESTGHYHWLPTLFLQNQGLDVRVVNPILAKQYTSGNIRKVKTDPADARGLARMAAVATHLPGTFNQSRTTLKLRKKLSVIASMEHQIQALNASLTSLQEAQEILQEPLSPAESKLRATVKDLASAIHSLEREFERESAEDEKTAREAKLLSTIPGVSSFVSHVVLQWFSFAEGRDATSWIAYAGLDISVRESGTWRGTCRLTKRGNNFLRRRLVSAGWGAMMHDPDWKKRYDELRKEGRPHVEALLILGRKIIRTMYVVLKNQTTYDPLKAFPSKKKI